MKSATFLNLVLFVLGLASLTVTAEDPRETMWAVLIAGSKWFWDYRHQANVAHAYHLLLKHGVQADHIITFMYDNIVNNTKNPYPGKLFNSPNGSDVYAGVKIDYRYLDITRESLFNVLKGNAAGNAGIGTGRVLGSTRNENVFIYYSDHGGTGTITLPHHLITKKDLNEVLDFMYEKNMYDKLLFYLEACHSGSMFEDLTDDKRIYAVTAAKANENAKAVYCKNRLNLPCLSDEFSVNWMHDLDVNDILTESVGQQVDDIAANVNKSHVSQFGDKTVRSDSVADYQGKAEVTKPTLDAAADAAFRAEVHASAVDSRQVPLTMAERALREANAIPDEIAARRQLYVSKRADLIDFVSDIVHAVVPRRSVAREIMQKKPARITAIDCHDVVVKAFNSQCAPFDENPYAITMASYFANLCEAVRDPKPILEQIFIKCANGPKFFDVL